MSNIPFSFRIALYGDSRVGKHSMLNSMDAIQMSHDQLEYFRVETKQEIQKRKIVLEIFYPLDSTNMNKTVHYHAALFLYDTTDSSSFNNIQNTIKELEKDKNADCKFFGVGTKKDLATDNNSKKKRLSGVRSFIVNTNDKAEISDMTKKITNSLITIYQKDVMKICLEITKELKDHPSSFLVREPVKAEGQYGDYYDVVKNPQFLSTIIKRLENDEYQSVESWQQDIEQIKVNFQLFNGESSEAMIFINEMFDVYKQLLKKLPPFGMNKISSRVNSKIKEVNELCDAPPPEMREMFPEGIVYTETDMKPFTDEDESLLVSEINELSSVEDTLEVSQIMDFFNVKKKPNGKYLEVDVNNLPNEAKTYLRSFVRSKVRAKKA